MTLTEPELILIPGVNNSPKVWAPLLDQITNQRESISAQVVECAALPTVQDVAKHVLLRCPERFYVCGFSFGGYVALAMLAQAPERVSGLVLVNSSGLADTAEASAHRRKSIAASRSGQFQKVALAQRPLIFHPSTISNPQLELMYRTMVEEYGSERFEAHMQACIDRPDRLEFLQHLSIPALVVAATDDRLIPPAIQRRTAEAIPRAAYVEIPGAGHMLPIERPEELAESLRVWWRTIGAPFSKHH